MKKLVIALFVVSISILEAQNRPGLFARVVHIEKNNVLTIRQKPDNKSKKVGSLPNGAYMGIEKCLTIDSSTWCKVYEVAQNLYETYDTGWVNSIYLSFSNKGYVVIDGKPSACFYALKCIDDKCLIVLDMSYNYEKDMMNTIKTEWIKKEIVRGESNYGAMYEEEDGFCNNARLIGEY